jgi:2-dehydropantoate 2-reductase
MRPRGDSIFMSTEALHARQPLAPLAPLGSTPFRRTRDRQPETHQSRHRTSSVPRDDRRPSTFAGPLAIVAAMRCIVYGAGAIGGVVGGRLHEHGHDVILIARGDHGRAIAADGLRIDAAAGSTVVHPPVVAHPSDLTFGPDDVVLLTMKTQHSEDAIETLAALAPPDLPIVCMQNGVESERLALRRFPHVHAVCVVCPATHLEPGVVQANSSPVSGLLDIGRYPSGTDDTAHAIAAALEASTFESIVRPDIMRWKYAKLLMNLGNAVEALCGPDARQSELTRRARREGAAVLRAAGIDAASRDEDLARRGDRLRLSAIGGQDRGGGSSWQSIQRGAGNIETDYLNGEIALLGRLHGTATPVNELLQRLAAELARTRAPAGTMTVDEVLAQIPHDDRTETVA